MSQRLPSIGSFPMPSPLAVLAVMESTVYGLVTRHAYDEQLPIAVPLTFVFFLLLPMAEGYRCVASGEARVGTLSPASVTLMLLTGAAFGDVLGLVCMLVLLPFPLLMALLGGIPASLVHAIRRRRIRGREPSMDSFPAPHRRRERGSNPSVPGPVFPNLILEISRCD